MIVNNIDSSANKALTGRIHSRKPHFSAKESSRNLGLLCFVVLSLSVSMSISQEEALEVGSVTYWLVVMGAMLLPLANMDALSEVIMERAHLLVAFFAFAGTWHLLRNDGRVVLQLGMIVWVTLWISTRKARLNVRDLTRLYMFLVFIGFALWIFTDLNGWGLLPGTTIDFYGVWRVSFTRNIAITSVLSLAIVMILTRKKNLARDYWIILATGIYFVLFSFVRSSLIALVAYFALRWLFMRRQFRSLGLFVTAITTAIFIHVFIAYSAEVFYFFQNLPLISRLFLRDESGLSMDEIYTQLYRPWMWMQHWVIFESSPWFMGWGTYDFDALKSNELVQGLDNSDSVSFPTRLLATYGAPTLFFGMYLLASLWNLSKKRDEWACACFPAVVVLMMNWGSVFHPSDALFVILMLMIIRGSAGFATTEA